jgi:hypothetical protein
VPVVVNTQSETATEAQQACTTPDIDFTWNEDQPPGPQTHKLCKLLAGSGELYRSAEGELLWLLPGRKPQKIKSSVELEGFIRYKFKIQVIKPGSRNSFVISPSHLTVLLKTRTLQEMLPVVDFVTEVPTYNSSWQMTRPGYNDGPEGERFYYTGEAVQPKPEPTHIREFLGAMSFKDKSADATNLAGLALTVLLRHMFPGAKPFAVVTANRSHAGKDTALDFAAGRTLRREISYSPADWPMQNEAVSALSDPAVGFLTIGNIRSGSRVIESSFIERLVTDPKPLLQSSRRGGDGFERLSFIVGSSANQGRFSTDLMNRSLPIRQELIGSLEDRPAPLGDLRHNYLPQHRLEIEAELCGMVETWKSKGCPIDESVRHPMKAWAQTIGGILKANGFERFLSNWGYERSAQDRVSESLGILAQAMQKPKPKWYRISEIAKAAVDEHVISDLIGSKHGNNAKAMERELGVLLSGLRDESLHFQSEEEGILTYRIRRSRLRVNGQKPATVYQFEPELKALE